MDFRILLERLVSSVVRMDWRGRYLESLGMVCLFDRRGRSKDLFRECRFLGLDVAF